MATKKAAAAARIPAGEAPDQTGVERNRDGSLKDEREKTTMTEGDTTGHFKGTVPAGKVDLDDNPDAPKITGQVEAAGSDRVLKLGDEVVLFTPNPINGTTRNTATVTRLNNDGTINAAVKRDDGQTVELNSIKNAKPDPGDISAYWQWAVDGETAKA